MQNISDIENEVNVSTFYVEELLVVPECFNLLLLFLGVYGMYQGVEIQHPLYAILFADMIVPMISSLVNIVSFPFVPVLKYIVWSNLSTVICLFFHCTCWCVTSAIRYIYIVHENWLQRVVPNVNLQCWAAFISTIVLALCCTIPMFAYGSSVGKNFN